jgi:sodium transport system permease protein
MRLFIVQVIWFKELVEILRDRRTLFRLLLLPIVIYPLFAIGVSMFQGSEMEAQQARASRVAVWGPLPPAIEAGLAVPGKITLTPWQGVPAGVREGLESRLLAPPPGVDPDAPQTEEESPRKQRMIPAAWTEPENAVLTAARELIARREVEAVLVPWPGLGAALDREERPPISLYFDPVRSDSMMARERIERSLRGLRLKIAAAREDARGLPRGFTAVLDLRTRTVALPDRSGGQLLGAMMPMMLILMAMTGGVMPAIDLTAGEKERNTMQTLLCAPVRPIEIIAGKFLAVFLVSLLTALANVVSLALTMRRIVPGDIPISAGTYALTFALLIPVSLLFSALFLALSVFARDFKDGQNVLLPVYLPVTLLAGLTSLPTIELNRWTALAPVLNIALLIKGLFLGEAGPQLVLLTLGSSLLYAALALVFAATVFEREHVLLGGKESPVDLLGLRRRDGGEPGPGFVLTHFAFALVALFYGSAALEHSRTIVLFLTTQFGAFLLPAALVVLIAGYSFKDTFAIRLPAPRLALGAVLLGLSAWSVVAGPSSWLFPPPPELTKALEKTLLFDGAPLPVLWLLAAVTPALCEEFVFRGLLFSGLRRVGPWTAILTTSLLFGLAHGSVHRMLPTFLLGLLMGTLRLRSGSIVPSMLLHLLNNGLVVTFLYLRPSWAESLVGDGRMPLPVIAAGAAVFACGLTLAVWRPTPPAATP